MAIFNKIPWTNFHELNINWIVSHLKAVEVKLAKIPLPLVSDIGKVLGAVSDGDGGVKLEYVTDQTGGDVPVPDVSDIGKVIGVVSDGAGGAEYELVTDQTGGSVPDPGSGDAGKVLKVNNDLTYSWQNETPCPVPTPGSGDNGKLLTAGSGGSMSWQTLNVDEVPTPGSGDNGKVLTAGSGGSYSWQTPSGGNVPTPTSGDNGKVLTAAGDGTYSWQTAPSGGAGTVIRNAYVTYAQVFVNDSDLCPPGTYSVMNQIAADMNAARNVSKDAMKQVYNRVKIRINGRTLPPDSLGWDASAKYNTSSERFDFWPTEEATTVRVSGSFKRVFYTGAAYKLYIPSSGTPALEYTAPTGYTDLTGGTLTPVTGVTALDDRMGERMIVEVEYDRAT